MIINKPIVLSLFSGAGGLDLGFHQCGYETVWANDIDVSAVETYRKNIGDVVVHGDIEDIDAFDNSIPDCDLIVGGFPCQDFSMLSKRKGLNTNRGNLYKSFLRFVEAKRPKAFVAENVKGILSANKGRAIQKIVQSFESLGYRVYPKLYNFADFGVPQNRERVLIVGIRNDIDFDFIHPEPTHGNGKIPYVVAGDALRGVERVSFNNEHIKANSKTTERLKLISEGGNYLDIPKDHPLYVKGLMSNIYKRLDRNKPAYTVIASGGGGTWGYHYSKPRALTNRERARLQSFPDDFKFYGTVSEVRKQIGNAVPPKGVHSLANSLKTAFVSKSNYKEAA